MDSRPMSFEEKKTLSANIGELDGEKLTKVVEIIQSRAPRASSQNVEAEIEIDLDKLDSVTLRQIEKFVKSGLSVSKRKQYTKKATVPKQMMIHSNTSTSSLPPQTVTNSSTIPTPTTTPTTHKKLEKNSSSESSDSSSDSSDSDEEKNLKTQGN
jgi:hypothetical protein